MIEAADPNTTFGHSSGALGSQEEGEEGLQLEKLTVPCFSGKSEDWSAFKSLFQVGVIDRVKMKDSSKFYFLRTKLTGEALELIQNIELTAENFQVAWKRLKDHYENKRRLVNSHLTTLLSLRPITAETSAEVKRLLSGTVGPLAALKTIGRPTEAWDDVIVFLTFSKLSVELKREWENRLGNSSTPPKFREMEEFLEAKVNNLKNLENAALTRFAQPAPAMGSSKWSKPQFSTLKSHQVTQTRKKSVEKEAERCVYCKKLHAIYDCEGFKQLAVDKKYEFANSAKLCYNCLGQHWRRKCPSRYRCSICDAKHHSLLHAEDLSVISHLTFQQSEGEQLESEEEEGVTEFQDDEQSSSNGLTLTFPGQSSVHFSDCKSAGPATNLLATAWLYIVNERGSSRLIRALVDPCSQASFITTEIHRYLNLPSEKCSLLVEGMNDAKLASCKVSTMFLIRPHFPSDYCCKVKAYVSSKISNYNPMTTRQNTEWSHFAGVQLADPHYMRKGSVDVLLGVGVYSRIIQAGLRKGRPNEPIALKTELGWLISGSTCEDQVDEALTLTAMHCNVHSELNDFTGRNGQPIARVTR